MIVFENINIVIEQDDDLQCIIQNWKGFATSEKYREGIEKTIELFKENNFNKILSNTEDFGLIKKEDTEWGIEYAMPLLIESGLKQVAFVVPKSVFAQISIDNFKKGSQNSVEIRYFDEVVKAREWMMGKG